MARRADDTQPSVGLDSLLSDALRVVPGRASSLYTPDLELGSPQGVWRSRGLASESLHDYMARYRDLDLWAQAARREAPPQTGRVYDTDGLVSRDRLVRSAFHQDYLRRYEIGRVLVGIVDDGRSSVLPFTRLTVIRAPSEPAFTSDEVGRFAALTRVARSFMTLALEHRAAVRIVGLQQSTVDMVRMPILVTDRDRRIGILNRSAGELLRAPGPLLQRGGQLRASDPRADRELGDALSGIADAPGDVRLVRLGIGRPGVRAPALLITATPDETGTAAVVRVLQPEPVPDDGEAILGLLLDLTQPEIAVALGLAEGLSHDEIARRRGVKVTTVRTTLRRVQEKLGVQRSGSLARLIQSLTAIGGLRL
ncbi:helix-turn-helix transcriptional regulator [Thalassobaculum sp.]|uniref:helix-turn-helix transcriptional regulator n=1 Tax=Thalassobaculum sp. TaxID=2022740 RepID=UPI0032EF06B0